MTLNDRQPQASHQPLPSSSIFLLFKVIQHVCPFFTLHASFAFAIEPITHTTPMNVLVFFSFFLFIGRCFANVECLPNESSSLLQLKEGLTFPSDRLVSWKPGSNCCNWEGVSCDSELGRVISLDLSMRNISGTIGGSLFSLSSLQTLNLAYNQFDSKPVPLGFERLINLTRLNLSNAGFVGQIPMGIFYLTEMVSLDLSSRCDDVRPVDSLRLKNPDLRVLVRKLINLKELYLDCVSISNRTEWYKVLSPLLPQLKVLSLKNCSLSGILPEDIFQLRNLSVLDLSDNKMLSGILPEFSSESSLQRLVLSHANLSGNITESIGNLKSLTELDLSSCSFSGLVPRSIGRLPRLLLLDLSFNSFTGAVPLFPPGARIVELNLASNGFSGQIPSFYGDGLHNLTILSLSNNSLSGPIPVSLFSLPALQAIYLNHNQLTGQLEEFQISSSSSLRTIDLSDNQLQRQIPRSLFKLPGLQFLGLASNNFSGILKPDLLYGLSNLTHLDLSNNKLSMRDREGNSSVSFPKLSTLKLASCNLINIPAFLKHQDRMTTLDLSNNKIAGAMPRWIWRIGNQTLMNLNLSYNLLTHVEISMPNFFHNSEFSPIILDLSSNMLQGPIPLPPRDTTLLDYSNNNFSSVIPFNISYYLNSTIFFSLANNSLTGEIPAAMCRARSLQILDLSDNHLRGPIPPCILEHRNDLVVLNLRGNKLGGTIPQRVSKGCSLKTINLNSNDLEGGLPPSLANCNDLEVIDLGNNRIVDPFPYWLGNIYVIRIIILRSNGFYGSMELPPWIPHNNYTFLKLQILDLSSNHFTGRLPAECFPNLKAMTLTQPNSSIVGEFVHPQLKQLSEGFFYHDTVVVTSKGRDTKLVKILTIYNYIDLSINNFTGSIPDALGQLQSLCVLNLSHNALNGHIPATFGNLMQLESLDLSANHLSGEIPQELASLTFLSVLNLSNNNLIGRIPQGNQLSTFSNTSYQGNRGLCGSPLSKQCSDAGPARNSTESTTEPDQESSDVTYEIGLALSIGLGYGFGIAVVLVLQNLSVREWKKMQQWLLILRSRDGNL